MMMMLRFAFAFAFAFVLLFGLVFMPSIQNRQDEAVAIAMAYAQGTGLPIRKDPSLGEVVVGAYTVVMSNASFASVDNDPKFADKNKVKASNIPAQNAQLDPALKHEYNMRTAQIVYDSVEKYNGTNKANHPASPLGKQGATVTNVMIHALRGYIVQGVDNPSIFVGDPDIAYVEPEPFGRENAQYTPRGIDRTDIDKAVTANYRPNNRESPLNVDVAVIDQTTHLNMPDLNVVKQVFIASCGSVPSSQCSQWPDTPGHGSGGFHGDHVSGTCCARDNLGGVVGVAQGARIHSVTICLYDPSAKASAGCAGVSAAFDWVVANAATIEVATMSVGCSTSCDASASMIDSAEAMDAAGVTFILAAGNEEADAGDFWCGDLVTAICVSALGDTDGKCGGNGPNYTHSRLGTFRDDSMAPFSNFGSAVDIMAPGWAILSTFPPGSKPVDSVGIEYPYIGGFVQDGYGVISGTSMAAPHVAGAAAVVMDKNPSFTPAQVKSSLQTNAKAQNAACDGFGGGGLRQDNSPSSEKLLYLQPY